ncbi:unnamed protein product [Ambrosiozyma monospora]|uniref:Unnamed protein product n=1 Tax=Ambrosiozyma monospora TaxID=43982 RepID=A0A9W6YYN8_AMBMO|nr:unnamed protein product [Ambrosiozyma monospora]
MSVLTSQRLLKLATTPYLQDYWYLIATVTLTVCNQPHDIPKIYHYALHLKQNPTIQPTSQLYEDVNQIISKYQDLNSKSPHPHYSPYVGLSTSKQAELFAISEKFRESILKASALAGLPKSINSMMKLKEVTPAQFKPLETHANRTPPSTIEQYNAIQQRGQLFWSKIYNKVSRRVINQLNSSYPDLWNHTIANVYSPLLSYTGILDPVETSIIVVSCLIPQDVNPQLKGHLKGALNNGVDLEVIRAVRQMSMDISSWCGVTWKADVATV